ncbi:MAG: type III secretion system cytoplasmic ring protein SctQ [Myxococcaceae bacterium]
MYTDPAATVSTTIKVSRLQRVGVRHLTRAHLALAARPQVAADAAKALEAMRAALEQQLGCPVAMQGRTVEVAVGPIGTLSRSSGFALLDVAAVGAKAVLEIELPLLCALLERMSGGPGKPAAVSRLTRIEEAAFSYLCLVGLAAVRGLETFQKRFGPRLLSVHTDRGEVLERVDCKRRHVAFEVVTTVGAVTGLIRLLVPALPLQSCIQDLEERRETEIAPEVLAGGLIARSFLGKACLDALDLESLVPGDVVMFDRVKLVDGALLGPGRLSTRGFDLHGQFDLNGFSLSRAESRAFPQELKMASPPVASGNPLPPLPVDVEVELTRLRLSLSELAMLKPGAVLPLHINASESVVLRVGDRAVARAELVDIEGEVGARILTLLP